MGLTAKLRLTKLNPDYPGQNEFSTTTEEITYNYDPGFKKLETVSIVIDNDGTVSNYEVRSIKKTSNIVNGQTVVIYGMSNIGVPQPE